ncbi:MAG: hypothetical protein GF355_04095 [Candidatus Eisenbacteria bacterium]|nr:hypothetical protein [Candidatus Eisenbacteria bacterium]
MIEAAAILIPGLAVYLIVAAVWEERESTPAGLILRIAMAGGLSIGLTACTTYLLFLLAPPSAGTLAVIDLAVSAGLVTVAVHIVRRRDGSVRDLFWRQRLPVPQRSSPGGRLLGIGLALAAVLALAAFIIRSLHEPHGGWDAWSIWNYRARLIFRGGADWTQAFSSLHAGSHPDYPPLLPLAIVRLWIYTGSETTAAPALIASVFTFGGIALLAGALARLRGRFAGIAGALALLGSGLYLKQGASQYADVPLAFAILSASALLFLTYDEHAAHHNRGRGGLVLLGWSAVQAAWTKNEGILFLCLVGAVLAASMIRRQGWPPGLRDWAALAGGAFLPGVLLLHFKLFLGGDSDLLTGWSPAVLLDRASEPGRIGLIVKAFFKEPLKVVGWSGLPLVAALGFLRIPRVRWSRRPAPAALAILGLMLGGYALAYLMTPHDVAWHLGTSLKRLYLHIFPAGLLLFFYLLRSPSSEAARTVPAGARVSTTRTGRRRRSSARRSSKT